jgi:hypothetical protein
MHARQDFGMFFLSKISSLMEEAIEGIGVCMANIIV